MLGAGSGSRLCHLLPVQPSVPVPYLFGGANNSMYFQGWSMSKNWVMVGPRGTVGYWESVVGGWGGDT